MVGLDDYTKSLEEVKIEDLEKIANLIAERKRIFVMGNGGSAATADHFASDLQKVGLTAISLCSNTPIVTRLVNDVGYLYMFSEQLKENRVGTDDVLIAISVSASSPNIIAAVKYAKGKGALIIGLTGFGRGATWEADEIVALSSEDYGVVEGVHSCLTHIIVDMVRETLAKD